MWTQTCFNNLRIISRSDNSIFPKVFQSYFLASDLCTAQKMKFSVKVNKSVYMAKSSHWYDKTLSNFLFQITLDVFFYMSLLDQETLLQVWYNFSVAVYAQPSYRDAVSLKLVRTIFLIYNNIPSELNQPPFVSCTL